MKKIPQEVSDQVNELAASDSGSPIEQAAFVRGANQTWVLALEHTHRQLEKDRIKRAHAFKRVRDRQTRERVRNRINKPKG